jgi:ATP-dependent Lon protease
MEKIFVTKADYIKDMNFHYVKEMREVIDLALLNDKVKYPINVVVPPKKIPQEPIVM